MKASINNGKSSSNELAEQNGNSEFDQKLVAPVSHLRLPLVWIDLEMTDHGLEKCVKISFQSSKCEKPSERCRMANAFKKRQENSYGDILEVVQFYDRIYAR
ncbi:hypothetical protein RND81_02G171200 [Saponaria officinalis]|uniref:Uncharacterized protein n=1 Tax=Saponaria officinalis TaxID=3572 RepID=A0AAW1MVB2_SAPOF